MKKLLWIPLWIMIYVALMFQITATNLIVDETPKVSDIIIVPEGDSAPRASSAGLLIKEGYSRTGKVIVSPLTDYNLPNYVAAGVSETQIINEPNATSTYTNATNTLRMMQELGLHSAIITTSDYHMLRTKLIYERQNRHYNFDLTYVAAYREVNGKLVAWPEVFVDEHKIAFKEFKKFWAYVFFLYHWVDE